ncbi:MAG: hypothetical protein J6Y85_05765 [Alphaproteobacteria bacterium]|nr:hypothetical protein [Alphaproteobacteria bacterium]
MFLMWGDIILVLMCGGIIGFLYAYHDRKHTRKQVDLFKVLLRRLSVSYFYQSKLDGVGYCSKNLALTLNLKSQDLSWSELTTHFDVETEKKLNDSYDALKKQGKPFTIIVHSANHVSSFKVTGQALPEQSFLATFQDISDSSNRLSVQQDAIQNLQNRQEILTQALENLPFPLFIRNQQGKNVFANQAVTQTAKSLNDMDWLSLPFSIHQEFYTMTYGQETKTEEELKIILKKMTEAHRRLCQELPTPVCLFSPKGELIACSKTFAKLWHLKQDWVNSSPSYEEYWDVVQEQGLLMRVADFAGYKKQQRENFARLSQASELFLYLPDGRLIRRVMIPYVQGSVILLDEITKTDKK